MSKKPERVFEGLLGREDEMRSRDAYVVVDPDLGSGRIAYWQQWVNGLYGRHVRITVEDLGPDHKCNRCGKSIEIPHGICASCANEDAP